MNRWLSLLATWAVTVPAVLAAAAQEPDLYRPLRTATAPTIDGKLDDPCWRDARRTEGFVTADGAPVTPRTTAMVCYDDAWLYVGVECLEPNPADLRRNARTEFDGVFLDDCVELFLRPRFQRPSYYQFVVNCAGVAYDALGSDGGWASGWQTRTQIGPDRWTAEMAIPFAAVEFGRSESISLVGMSLCRTRPRGNTLETSCWPVGGWYHNPAGHLLFSDYAEFIRRELLPEWTALRDSTQQLLAGAAQDETAGQVRQRLVATDRDFRASLAKNPIRAEDVNRLCLLLKTVPAEISAAKRRIRSAGMFAGLERKLTVPEPP